MKPSSSISFGRRAGPRQQAFSLVEIMLAVSIMGVIVFALYATFSHTQRALRSNVTQVDVLAAGRLTMDLLTRELAQASACRVGGGTNLLARLNERYVTAPPVHQPLLGRGAMRTNLLDDLYFITYSNRNYVGTIYRVLDSPGGVGTLGRFSTAMPEALLRSNNLSARVLSQPATNFVPLAEGVIHFRVRPYDQDGLLMDYPTRARYTNVFLYTNIWVGTNVYLQEDLVTTETRSVFLSNALPACLEVELGVLEPHVLTQWRSLVPGSGLAGGFLSNHVGQVHLFRQRVPIRQSPPIRTAYR